MLSVEDTLWLLRALKKIGFFSILTVDEIKKLVSYFIKKEYDKNDIIIRQGDPGDFFFIIGTGTVSVWIETENGKEKIATLTGNGDYFGEISLITGKPRNATVIADEHCEIFLLYRSEFEKLLNSQPELKEKFSKTAIKRIEETDTLRKIKTNRSKKNNNKFKE
jgi:CRP-like cAMP-binding protein